MIGLRAKQKANRNRRILQAATDLFHEVGYDHARIEDIAERAEVSVGTFYNYFQNKGDVLVAIVSMEVEEVLESGWNVVQNPPSTAFCAVQTLISQYVDHSLMYLSKGMWRTAMAISIQQPDSPFSQHYTELDMRLCQQVSILICNLQACGAIISAINAEAVGEMFFNNLNMMFIEFVKDETMTLDVLKRRLARQNKPLADLISTSSLSV